MSSDAYQSDAQFKRNDFRSVKVAIRVISILDIILGTLSMLLQVPLTAIVNDKIYMDYELYNGIGIWVGIFYCLTGALGLASGSVAGKSNRNKLLILALVLTAICVPLSWLAITASFSHFYLFNDILREIYTEQLRSMKIALGIFNILASIANIILIILTSVETCCINGCCCPVIPIIRNDQAPIRIQIRDQPSSGPINNQTNDQAISYKIDEPCQ